MDQDETWHAGRPQPWPHCVRWGHSTPSPNRAEPLPNFQHISVVAKWLDGLRCHLVWRQALAKATLCYMGTQLPLLKSGQSSPPQIFDLCPLWPNGSVDHNGTWQGGGPSFRPYCAKWRPAPLPKRGRAPSPIFGPFLLSPLAKRLDASRFHLVWR